MQEEFLRKRLLTMRFGSLRTSEKAMVAVCLFSGKHGIKEVGCIPSPSGARIKHVIAEKAMPEGPRLMTVSPEQKKP